MAYQDRNIAGVTSGNSHSAEVGHFNVLPSLANYIEGAGSLGMTK